MDPAVMLPVAAFAAMTCGAWALLTILTGRKTRAAERLEELRDPGGRRRSGGQDGNKMSSMIEKAAPALSKALESKDADEQNSLKTRLANAGFSSPNATRNFLAIKVISLVLGLMFGGVYLSLIHI